MIYGEIVLATSDDLRPVSAQVPGQEFGEREREQGRDKDGRWRKRERERAKRSVGKKKR